MTSDFNKMVLKASRVIFELTLFLDGNPLDLTSYATTDLTYYLGASGAAPLTTITMGSGITVVDPSQGQITITLSATQTDLNSGVYVHELWDFRSPKAEPVFAGKLVIRDSLKSYV